MRALATGLIVGFLLTVSCGAPQTCATCVDAGASAGGAADAGSMDAGVVDAGCAGACATTDLRVSFGNRMASFERAQHGRQADGRVLVEAHAGGDSACPSMTSPTPLRTLSIANLRVLPDGGAVTYADGLRVSLFDFSGAVTSAPLERAVDARAVARWLEPGVLVSFQLTATFEGARCQAASWRPTAPHSTNE